MSAITRQTVEATLRQYQDPYLNQDPVSAGCLREVEIQGDRVRVRLELGYAAGLFRNGLAQTLQMALEALDGVARAEVRVDCVIQPHKAQPQVEVMGNVKNIVAVASGKGGVGKSTTAANLALALAREGARVGILDADIYGPSQGIMFGLPEGTRPKVREQKWFEPLEAHGVQVMSMAFLTDDSTPVVWRGPMVSGALIQLITQTAWDNLDYLVVDMPPGTGDIQLTLAQKVPVAGAVIVTTPQDLALLDAQGRRLAASRRYLDIEAEGHGRPLTVPLEDGRKLSIMRPDLRAFICGKAAWAARKPIGLCADGRP